MTLSDVKCRNAAPKQKPYKLGDSGGLYLMVNPTGSKLWRLKYRFAGKERTLSIGQYPEVTLRESREARDRARKLIAGGHDPSLAKQEQKRTALFNNENTFETVAREWHTRNNSGWSENHSKTVLRRLESDLFPEIGNVPIGQIDTPRIVAIIEKIEKRGVHEVARRALQYCRAVFSHAQIRGVITANPATIKAKDFLPKAKRGHFAALEAKDLPEFLSRLYANEERRFRQTQLALELLMLTFVRTNELLKAEWSEIDFDKATWKIPGARMKMGKDHLVPLSRQAIGRLLELKQLSGMRTYIFPGQRNPRQHMSNGAILMALDRMGYRGQHTGHGFRSLATSTILEELNYEYDIIDVQLAHSKKSDVHAAYNRAKYLKQRTKMMQDWADYLDAVANAHGKVLKFGNFDR